MAAEAPSDNEEVAAALLQRVGQVLARMQADGLHPAPRNQPVTEGARVDRVWVRDENPPLFVVGALEPGRESAIVRIPLVIEEGFEPRPVCTLCEGACKHGALALSELMQWLLTPTHPRRAEVLAAARLPPWRRWLDRLDEALDAVERTSEARATTRLWWSVDPQARRFHAYVQSVGRSGTHLAPKRVRLEDVDRWAELSPADRRVLMALKLHQAQRRQAEREGRADAAFATTLVELENHPRVAVGQPGGSPWQVLRLPVRFRVEAAHGEYELVLYAGDRPLSQEDLLNFEPSRPRLFVSTDRRRLELLTLSPEVAQLLVQWARGAVPVPADARTELMSRVSRASAHVGVEGSDVIRDQTVEARLDLIAVLTPLVKGGLHVEVRVRPLREGPLLRPGSGSEHLLTATPDRQILRTERDLDDEIAVAEAACRALGVDPFEDRSQPWTVAISGLGNAQALLERLRESDRFECQWPQEKWSLPSPVTAEKLRLSVRSGHDFLGIYGGLEWDGARAELAVLIEAAQKERGFLALDGGRFLKLEAALAGRLAELGRFLERKGRAFRLNLAGLDALKAVLETAGETEEDDAYRQLIRRVDDARTLEPEVPLHLQDVLRPYQREGYVWMSRLAAWGAGAVLADDMGLGKTVQAISMLSARAELGPQMVVAPTSVAFNWSRELARFAPMLKVIPYAGPKREAQLASAGPNSVILSTYGVVQRDAVLLAERRFASLVLDEAQAIKNPKTRRARAVRALNADWVLALTGTPVENHPGELWALFSAVFPGLLGSWEGFRARFLPEEEARPSVSELDRPRTSTPSAPGEGLPSLQTTALRRAVRPFVLRRTKALVARELPEKTEITVDISLSRRERALYEDARLAALAAIKDDDVRNKHRLQFRVFSALTRLRQLACHPRLVDDTSRVPSSKLERLLQILHDLREEGRRTLIFSQFVRQLDLVQDALEASKHPFCRLDGRTPERDRARAVDRFQSGTVPVFLISLKAGGTGLNLTAADTVIHLDPWWNPAVEDQATDRAHRIGQSQPVTVLRLVSRDTVEPAMLRLNLEKRRVLTELMAGADAPARLDIEDMKALLRGQDPDP